LSVRQLRDRFSQFSPISRSCAGQSDRRGAGAGVTISIDITLDPIRPTPQVSNIAQSILSELDRARGTKLTLTLDIDAETPDGFPEDVESIVRDNAASLRITDFGFRASRTREAVHRTELSGRGDQLTMA
jgi:hypothetical protein